MLAHILKGAAGNFGSVQFSELARTLEHAANRITPGDYRALLGRLNACFGRARQELEAVLTKNVA
jgi:hypothetical protein